MLLAASVRGAMLDYKLYYETMQQAPSSAITSTNSLPPQPGAVYMAGIGTGNEANLTSNDVVKMESALWESVTLDMQGQVMCC